MIDVVVVGSGPNGLAAAITVAQAGHSVVVLEANSTIGGAARSGELTRPGFVHDLGSAIHPMAVASPFLRRLDLAQHGLDWVMPPAAVAHPLDNGRAAIIWNDLERTSADLGVDGRRYRRLFEFLVEHFDAVLDLSLRPVLRVPRHPIVGARFGALAALPAPVLARQAFQTDEARAAFAGHAAHAILPLAAPLTSAFGLMLGASAHAVGWPFPRGGAQAIADALAAELRRLGGEIRTGHQVAAWSDLPPAKGVVLALTPQQIVDLDGAPFGARYRKALRRFRYGPGALKVDYALSEPVPWSNPDIAHAGTVHVAGTLQEVVDAEATVARGSTAERPFVLVAQHTRFDPTRAPAGKHTLWAYCHVPNGWSADVSERIDAQIERFAPGFRDTIEARTVSMPDDLERQNANLVGGDVGSGSHTGTQLLFRPRFHPSPWETDADHVVIGSASAVPGGAVHGMAGHQAARHLLDTIFA